MPSFLILWPIDDGEKISVGNQKLFWSGIGMKYLRPDTANASWELSKVMNGANQVVFLRMHYVIKYVLDTMSLCLKIEAN